jgi:hypothetical protein
MYKQYIKFLPLMLLFSLSAAQMPRKENSKVTNKEYQKFGNDVINSPFTNFFLNTFSLFSRVYFVYYLFPASLLVSLLLLELLIYIKFFIVEKNTFSLPSYSLVAITSLISFLLLQNILAYFGLTYLTIGNIALSYLIIILLPCYYLSIASLVALSIYIGLLSFELIKFEIPLVKILNEKLTSQFLYIEKYFESIGQMESLQRAENSIVNAQISKITVQDQLTKTNEILGNVKESITSINTEIN